MPHPASLPNWPIRDSITALLCLYLAYILASTMFRGYNYRDSQDIGNNPTPGFEAEWI